MFYKNILETVPIWVFGIFSMFSGTQIYNTLLYVSYNLFFTALPIIWFATFDWEYSKEVLKNRPRLYNIGLQDRYFNRYVFFRWFFYACAHSTLILVLTLFTIDQSSPNVRGMFGGLFVDGGFIFTVLVIVANVKVLISSYLITFWLIFLVIGSVAFYFLSFWIVSIIWVTENDYYAFQNMATFPETYFSFFFFCAAYVLVDSGLHYLGIEINAWYSRRLALEELQEKIRAKQDTTTIRRKVTFFKRKCNLLKVVSSCDISCYDISCCDTSCLTLFQLFSNWFRFLTRERS